MTAHVAKAHKVMARYYAEQGKQRKAEGNVSQAAFLLRKSDDNANQAEFLLTNIQQLAVNSLLGISFPDSTLPKDAINGQIKRYHDSRFNTASLASLNSLWIVLARDDVIGIKDLPLTVTSGHQEEEKEEKPLLELMPLDEAEKMLIEMALQKHNGVQTRAAKELGISERALRYKIKIKGKDN